MKTSPRLAALLTLCVAPVAAQTAVEIQPLTVGELEKLVGPPTTVTLQMNAAPATILGEIGRQSGVKVDYFQTPQVTNVAPLSVNWKNEPFWSAVQAVGKEARLRIDNSQPWLDEGTTGQGFGARDENRGIPRVARISEEPVHLAAVGAEPGMRAERVRNRANAKSALPAFSVAFSPYLTFNVQRVFSEGYTARFSEVFASSDNRDVDNVTLRGNLLIDPALSRFLVALKITVDGAVTDSGAVLQAAVPYLEEGALIRHCKLSLPRSAQLGSLGPESKKIASLRGKVTMVVVSGSETWEITDLANARNKTKSIRMPDGVWTFTYGGVKTEGRQHSVNVSVACPAKPEPLGKATKASSLRRAPDDLNLAWTRRVRLEDARSRSFLPHGIAISADDALLTADMQFFEPGAVDAAANAEPRRPAQLTIEIPTEFRQIEIPFEIRDIPLPAAPV